MVDTTSPNTLRISRKAASLRQQVTDQLRHAVTSGHFRPGMKLIERELCETFDISRTVLREALQHLQAEGLITHIPHKGPVVSTIDEEEARDIYKVRQCLEVMATQEFTVNATDEEIAELRKIVDQLAETDIKTDTEGFLRGKDKFYEILLTGAGNRIMKQMLTNLNNRVVLMRRISLAQDGRSRNTINELYGILHAIEERDSVKAGHLCFVHVENAASAALSALSADTN